MDARARADVEDVVCGADQFFVVLNDEDGVAYVGEVAECGDESVVVARMQTDGWFVEDVARADEFATDLCCEADALCFSARECACFAVEAEVFEADGFEETQSRHGFADDWFRDRGLFFGESERA